MPFVLTGFTNETGFRVFAFARMDANRTRTEYTVRADLSLSRKYEIPMQALPLLCRNLLEHCKDLDQTAVTFTEEDMRLYASTCAAAREAAKKRAKVPHRPGRENLGSAWRGHARPVDPRGDSAK